MECNRGAIAISEARLADVRERNGEDGRIPAVVVGCTFEEASAGEEDGLLVRGEALDGSVRVAVGVPVVVGHIDVITGMELGEEAVQEFQLVL